MAGKDGKADNSALKPVYPRRATYGRRRGRRLRPGQSSLLGDLLPRLHVTLPTTSRTLDLEALFSRETDSVWLEIGFGAGEHLAWQAARHPEVSMLGAEVYVNGIISLLRHIERDGQTNVRILQGDGRELLDVLPERSLDRIFILFPDPWPKLRHQKRRIVQRPLLDRLAFAMNDNAELRIATDHSDYLIWMLDVVTSHPDFEWLARGPRDWRQRPTDWPASRYELKAQGEGRRLTFLRLRRRPRKG